MRVHFFRHCLYDLLLCVFGVYFVFILSTIYLYNYSPAPLEDHEPPVVTLIDGENNRIAVGTGWEDPGVDAYDIFSDVYIKTEGEVEPNTVGEYSIKYIVSDESGNTTEITRTVSIIQPAGTIYLTFDDGPGEHTGRLLDVLKKYNVKATFFVTGRGDDSYFKREYDEGHTVALHTNTHNYSYIYSSVDNYFEDLYTISDRVKSQIGIEPKLIRFPGGSSNLVSTRYDHRSHIMSTLVNEVTARGYTFFDWNVDSGDAGGASSADEVYNNVISRLNVGGDSVVLQHDIKGFSVDAVERIIQYGISNDFLFKKLSSDSFNAHHSVNN